MNYKKEWMELIVGFLGALLGLTGLVIFNKSVLMSLSLLSRMIGSIVSYWLIAIIPLVMICLDKKKNKEYLSSEGKIFSQFLVGIIIGIMLSILCTLVPHILGFDEYVDTGKRYTHLWQFIYEFIYCLLSVGFVEELVFRGFLYDRIKRISGKDIFAVIGSSVLFGIFHLFSGNSVQMILTTLLGAFFCLCRLKLRNCSLLSLIIAHGIYDAMITVWASLLLR